MKTKRKIMITSSILVTRHQEKKREAEMGQCSSDSDKQAAKLEAQQLNDCRERLHRDHVERGDGNVSLSGSSYRPSGECEEDRQPHPRDEPSSSVS